MVCMELKQKWQKYARKGLANNLQPRRSEVYKYIWSTVYGPAVPEPSFPVSHSPRTTSSSFQLPDIPPSIKMPDAQDLVNVTYSTAEVRLTTELFHYFIVRGRSTSMLRKEIDDGEVSV